MSNISTSDVQGIGGEAKANPRVLDITCRFCGIKTGEAEIPPRLVGQNVTLADLDIADSRCDVCITEKGTVQEAELHYHDNLSELGGTTEEFAEKLEEFDGDAKAMMAWTEEENSRRKAEIAAEAEATAQADAKADADAASK